MKERGLIRRVLEKVATGYTAANTAFVGGGIPNPDMNQDQAPVSAIVQAEPTWIRPSPLDPIVIRPNSEEGISQEANAGLRFFYDAINSHVDTSTEPLFWKEMEEKIAADPKEYLIVSEKTTGKNVFPNEHTYQYFQNGISRLDEVSFPSVEVIITDPDSFEYLSSVTEISLQFGDERTLASYRSNINIPYEESSISREELEVLAEDYFTKPLGMVNLWVQDPSDSGIIYSRFVDSEGAEHILVAIEEGFISYLIYSPSGLEFPATDINSQPDYSSTA